MDDTPRAVQDKSFVELSGLTASRRFPRVLYGHNDSGDAPRLLAIDDTGATLGELTVAGAEAVDWEDIASGPGPEPDRSYLYVGDIGDNGAARDHLTVYRLPEPATAPSDNATLEGAEAIDLRYDTGPADAEALLVDPESGDLYIITKVITGRSVLLEATAEQLDGGGPITMATVGELDVADLSDVPGDPPGAAAPFPGTLVTAADISPDGSAILVRTYQDVLTFGRADGASIVEALATTPCRAPSITEPQAEAVAFSATGDAYFTTTEVQLAIAGGQRSSDDPIPLSRFTVEPPVGLTPTTTAPPTTGSPTTTVKAPESTTPTPGATTNTSDDHAMTWLLAGLVGLAVVAVAAMALVARRRRAS